MNLVYKLVFKDAQNGETAFVMFCMMCVNISRGNIIIYHAFVLNTNGIKIEIIFAEMIFVIFSPQASASKDFYLCLFFSKSCKSH